MTDRLSFALLVMCVIRLFKVAGTHVQMSSRSFSIPIVLAKSAMVMSYQREFFCLSILSHDVFTWSNLDPHPYFDLSLNHAMIFTF